MAKTLIVLVMMSMLWPATAHAAPSELAEELGFRRNLVSVRDVSHPSYEREVGQGMIIGMGESLAYIAFPQHVAAQLGSSNGQVRYLGYPDGFPILPGRFCAADTVLDICVAAALAPDGYVWIPECAAPVDSLEPRHPLAAVTRRGNWIVLALNARYAARSKGLHHGILSMENAADLEPGDSGAIIVSELGIIGLYTGVKWEHGQETRQVTSLEAIRDLVQSNWEQYGVRWQVSAMPRQQLLNRMAGEVAGLLDGFLKGGDLTQLRRAYGKSLPLADSLFWANVIQKSAPGSTRLYGTRSSRDWSGRLLVNTNLELRLADGGDLRRWPLTLVCRRPETGSGWEIVYAKGSCVTGAAR